ncbi:MAG: hypothetical protein GF320_06645 [Armatimonadia bacterium]|nr:hypothetical protein [Armatimonadia bacterium]
MAPALLAAIWLPLSCAASADGLVLGGGLADGHLTVGAPETDALLRMEPLFGITFGDGQMLQPGEMRLAELSEDGRRARWEHPRAVVEIELATDGPRLLLSGRVTSRSGVIIHVALPHTFQVVGPERRRLLWPETLGVELNADFLRGDASLWLDYPPAFCDFVSAEIDGKAVHIHRAEAEKRPLPATLHVAGGDPPIFRRFHWMHVSEGESWRVPAVAVQVGGELRQALEDYKRDCGLGRALADKLDPRLLARWRGMAEGTVLPPFANMADVAQELRLPAILQPVDWMRGGFDRMYPNFLPPRDDYGGEEGFRAFIETAHGNGHLVAPYTNWTWWCAGWDGPESRPAPIYATHGTAALSKGLDGQPIFERYGPNYGYTVTPGHPIAAHHRWETLNRLLDDYGADFPYFDQVGPRRWILDLNPALPDPAAYGAELMAIHREMAEGLPVGGEFGNDRALDFLCAMNYWCVPPLSGHPHWPGVDSPPWPSAQGRSFPYALYLSSGDALVSIPDCLSIGGLSWSMVLGGRVGLGWALTGDRLRGDLGPRVRWLQELARTLGPTRGERLVALEYLAPRVLRAEYETHRVIANFSERPWPTGDGHGIPPSGFDLDGQAVRAGQYVSKDGGVVSAFRLKATGRALQLDARGLRPGWPAPESPEER